MSGDKPAFVNDADLALALARSEAKAAGLLAQAMRDQGIEAASSEPCRAGQLVSLGVHRYVNRLISTKPNLDEVDVAATVDYFSSKNLRPSIQVSSSVSAAATDLLSRRGFEVELQRVVLACRARESPNERTGDGVDIDGLTVEVVGDDLDDWLSVLSRGNGATTSQAQATSDEFARAAHGVGGSVDLLARINEKPVACGSLQPVDGVAWLGGAATIPEYRGNGLQRALLGQRISMSNRRGYCHVAATAAPNGPSMRNLMRAGLVLVDTQLVWTRRAR